MGLSTYALVIVIIAAVIVAILLLYCEYDRRRFWEQSEAIARSQYGANPVKHQETTPHKRKGADRPSLMDKITGRHKQAFDRQTQRGVSHQGSRHAFDAETVPVDTESRSGDQPEIFMTNTFFHKDARQAKNSAMTTRMPSEAAVDRSDDFYSTGKKPISNKGKGRGASTPRQKTSTRGEQKSHNARQNLRGVSSRNLNSSSSRNLHTPSSRNLHSPSSRNLHTPNSSDRRSPLDRMESFR